MVAYEGFAYVAVKGMQAGRVSPAVVAALVARFRDANFLAALPVYVGAFDAGDDEISLTINGATHNVDDSSGLGAGLPTKVLDLERAIDVAAGTARWVRIQNDEVPARELEHWSLHDLYSPLETGRR